MIFITEISKYLTSNTIFYSDIGSLYIAFISITLGLIQ